MPIPSPKKQGKKSDFISRCASDSVMDKEYPDAKQRVAICYSKWTNKKKKAVVSIQLEGDDEIIFLSEDSES